MKVTEEIDAIRTLGLSPIQVLVLPRLLAIVISMPLLTFAADVMGILGAALVSAQQLDITPYTFFARLQDVLPPIPLLMGLAKTPLFAVAIAIIACHNGFTVTRDARSVGRAHHLDGGALPGGGDPDRRPVLHRLSEDQAVNAAQPPLEVAGVRTRLGGRWLHDGVDFSVPAGQIVALIGGSGTGKTVLLRECIGLGRPDAGAIRLFGEDICRFDAPAMNRVRRRFGVLFQEGALFSSLSVAENVAVPLVERTDLPAGLRDQVVALKIRLAGLPADAAGKRPSELSGGMKKRAALARALALEPELLFLDEPTSGLDPISAREFDALLRTLRDSLGITVLMTTHDLDTLWGMVDRVVVLHAGKVIADGPVAEVARLDHPWIRAYFSAHAEGRGHGI
jgi:phospholipid/cholesterol/gamma-HCH transport system ATP-binding protein